MRQAVRKVASRVPASVERDALISAGMVGLLDALDRYDGERGVAFEAYARIRIRGAILDELRGLDHLTRTQRRRSRAVAASQAELEKDGVTSDGELAEQLGWSVAEVQAARQGRAPPRAATPDDLERRADPMWGAGHSTDRSLLQQEQLRVVSRALAGLPERERLVVGLYYEAGITLQEIGELLGVTQSRVSQILKKIMVMLREQVTVELG
ncbi:MAG: sigma-70 family RNA polymerase sigma factor [Deltaproteobacteria bacterium]|nr:sigma-70 family RNA polymerase sigma factor [Deltaproteobacteria bacterium]